MEIKDKFNELLKTPTIFVCGKKEKLKIIQVEFLVETMNSTQLHHFYFIEPDEDLLKHLNIILTSDKFSVINNLNEIVEINRFNILCAGFELMSSEFDFLKTLKSNILIFFENLGYFKNSLEKANKHIYFAEQTFSGFALQQHYTTSDTSQKISISQGTFFTNRGAEIDRHRKFLANNDKRVCKITGLAGIGKQAFINELKRNFGLNTNCFEININSKTDSINEIIKSLSLKLNLLFDSNLELSDNNKSDILKKIFLAFDKLENAKIIFYNVQEIYDTNKNCFFKSEFSDFFLHIINRDSYVSNKLYLVSLVEFKINDTIEKYVFDLNLSYLEPIHIKFIISQEFSDRNKDKLAIAARNLDEQIVEKIVSGHPYVAKLFVKASEEIGMDNIINDLKLQRYFETNHKVKYLIDKIKVTEFEEKLLKYLVLFKHKIELNFLNRISADIDDIVTLVRKFFVEISHFENESIHHVPELIKSYIISRMTESELIKNHSFIGDFYWENAENFENTPAKVFEFYRLTYFHFEKANNSEKLKLLVLRFKDKFLEKAEVCYKKGDYKNAWEYYNELQINDNLSEKKYWNFYLKSGVETNQKNISHLFDKALDLFPNDEFIKTTLASYFLYNLKDVKKSESVCFEIMNDNPSNFGINNFFANVLYEKGEYEEALKHLEIWISKFESIKVQTENDKKQLKSFKETHSKIKTKINNGKEKKEVELLKSKLGNLKGDHFESMLQELIKKIYPDCTIEQGKKVKDENKEYEYDFIITNPSEREIIVIEAKGKSEKIRIKQGNSNEPETIAWFFNNTFPVFKKNYPNPHNYQIKASYITSAFYSEDAIAHLNNFKDCKLKSKKLLLYYDRDSLTKLLSENGLKNKINELQKHYKD